MAKNSPDFYAAILRGIGAPVTDANIKVLDAWQKAEGSNSTWNPFNSTQSSHTQGETNYNSVGVKNYPTETAGITATIATLKNGYYGPMITALKNNNQEAFIQSLVASPWDGGYGGRGAGKTYKNSSVYRLYIQGGGVKLNTKGAAPAPTTAHTTAGPQQATGPKNKQNKGVSLNPLSGFETLARILTDGQFWIRLIEMLGGSLLVAYGVFVLTTGKSGIQQAAGAAKLAML